MKQWLTYKSEDEDKSHDFRVCILDDTDTVIFFATKDKGSRFSRREAVRLLRDLLNVMEAEQ